MISTVAREASSVDLEALPSNRVANTPATLRHDSRTTENEIQSLKQNCELHLEMGWTY